jgi:hypothetical protein
MQSLIARLPTSPCRSGGHRWSWGLVAIALLALVIARLLPAAIVGGQPHGSSAVLVNPCTGETIALRESAHLLPHVAPGQAGSREASVNAVGQSGVGSRGTYFLPMGTGKVVLTFASGTLDFAAGTDLELIGRGTPGQDFRFHSIGHLKVSATGGLSGTGLTVQARCGH